MKKLTISIGLMAAMMMSCEKESYKVRNYTYPGDLENPTGIPQLAAGI